LSVPPARETGTGVVGLAEGMSPSSAGDVACGAEAVSDAIVETALSTTGAALASGRIMVMTVVRVHPELTAGVATSAGDVAAGGAASGVEAWIDSAVVETTVWGCEADASSCPPVEAPPKVNV